MGPRAARRLLLLLRVIAAGLAIVLGTLVVFGASPADAQVVTPPITAPDLPTPQAERTAEDTGLGGLLDDGLSGNDATTDSTEDTSSSSDLVTVTVGDANAAPSQSLILIIGLGILSLAPSLVIMLSSFTRIVIVLSMTRNALGLQGVPPNQVITGLALFLSLFVMGPTLDRVNNDAFQPFMDGQIQQGEALDRAQGPIREFMLAQQPTDELTMILDARGVDQPETPDDISMSSLIPAFLLHELKAAFIIGMVIFIPFVIIDLIVSATLMSLGMMMLPPVFVSLPFKLMLFIMVGGWSLVVQTLLESFKV
ncbi:MAG: flagellar type III secretion system pore protein FliP [Acidimicrobiales bacterium]